MFWKLKRNVSKTRDVSALCRACRCREDDTAVVKDSKKSCEVNEGAVTSINRGVDNIIPLENIDRPEKTTRSD